MDKPGGAREGYVDRPYTMADAEARLAEVSGSPAFARDFFASYIQGHEVADYAPLLRRAGLVLQPQQGRRAWLGDVRFDNRGGAIHIASPPPVGSPAYAAGIDLDDEIRQLDGESIRSAGDVAEVLRRRKPGDNITVVFVDRTGAPQTATLQLGEDPTLELLPIESTGGSLTANQQAFRNRWLN